MILDGQTIVITGAFGSLGASVVKAAHANGARVAAIDTSADPGEVKLEGVAYYGGIDLANAASAGEAMKRIAAELGGVDGLVNIAGGFRWEKIQGGSLDTWDFLYNVNVRTAAAATQAALPYLLTRGRGGRVINIGAAGAVKAASGMGAYAASKAAVAKLTEALADELKEHGITVNALLPSIIDTPRNRADMPEADYSKWVTGQQLADIIVFLLSPQSQPITGALIPVTGGV